MDSDISKYIIVRYVFIYKLRCLCDGSKPNKAHHALSGTSTNNTWMPFLEAPLAQDPLHGKNAEGVEETQPWPQDQGNSCHTSPLPWDQGWMFRLDSCATVKRTPQLDGIAVLELDCTVNVQTVPFPSNISVFGAHHRRCWGARRSDSSGVHQCQKPPRAIASCRVESPTQAWVLQSCRFTIQ